MNEGPGPGERVRCHSGYTYAQRPVSFSYEGNEYKVERIIAETRLPEARQFLVTEVSGRVFELCYDEAEDAWQVRPCADPRQGQMSGQDYP